MNTVVAKGTIVRKTQLIVRIYLYLLMFKNFIMSICIFRNCNKRNRSIHNFTGVDQTNKKSFSQQITI